VPVVLLSKDKAVLRLKKRLATLGVTVVPKWQPPAAPSPL
jgi:hypothetical protein